MAETWRELATDSSGDERVRLATLEGLWHA